jgi:hypothetical protein
LADIDPDGSKRWDVTHIKTRDAFTHDAIIITKEYVRFVDYYLSNIRPGFAKLYVARKHDLDATKAKERHSSGTCVCVLDLARPNADRRAASSQVCLSVATDGGTNDLPLFLKSLTGY